MSEFNGGRADTAKIEEDETAKLEGLGWVMKGTRLTARVRVKNKIYAVRAWLLCGDHDTSSSCPRRLEGLLRCAWSSLVEETTWT